MASAAVFILTVFGIFLTVQGLYEKSKYLSSAYADWKRTLEVSTNTAKALMEKGYDMDKLKGYSVNALKEAEVCYDTKMNKQYPDYAPILKPEIKEGLQSFGEEDWNAKLLQKVIGKIQEKETNDYKIMRILNAALESITCYDNNMEKQMKKTSVSKPTTGRQNNNLYECVLQIYEGQWRKFNLQCRPNDKDDSIYYKSCINYEPCKEFEVNKA